MPSSSHNIEVELCYIQKNILDTSNITRSSKPLESGMRAEREKKKNKQMMVTLVDL